MALLGIINNRCFKDDGWEMIDSKILWSLGLINNDNKNRNQERNENSLYYICLYHNYLKNIIYLNQYLSGEN